MHSDDFALAKRAALPIAWGEAGKYVSEPESANTASSVFDY
jgi:hypothetical protein